MKRAMVGQQSAQDRRDTKQAAENSAIIGSGHGQREAGNSILDLLRQDEAEADFDFDPPRFGDGFTAAGAS